MSALCLLTVGQTPAILRPVKAGPPGAGQGYSRAAKPPLRAVPAIARQLRAGAERRRIAQPPAHHPLASRPDGTHRRQRAPASCPRSSLSVGRLVAPRTLPLRAWGPSLGLVLPFLRRRESKGVEFDPIKIRGAGCGTCIFAEKMQGRMKRAFEMIGYLPCRDCGAEANVADPLSKLWSRVRQKEDGQPLPRPAAMERIGRLNANPRSIAAAPVSPSPRKSRKRLKKGAGLIPPPSGRAVPPAYSLGLLSQLSPQPLPE